MLLFKEVIKISFVKCHCLCDIESEYCLYFAIFFHSYTVGIHIYKHKTTYRLVISANRETLPKRLDVHWLASLGKKTFKYVK